MSCYIWSCIIRHFRPPFFLRSCRCFNASISRSIFLWRVLCTAFVSTVTARCLPPTLMPRTTPVARCGSTGTCTAICNSNIWSECFVSLFTYRVTSTILNERISNDSRMALAVSTTPNPGICMMWLYFRTGGFTQLSMMRPSLWRWGTRSELSCITRLHATEASCMVHRPNTTGHSRSHVCSARHTVNCLNIMPLSQMFCPAIPLYQTGTLIRPGCIRI